MERLGRKRPRLRPEKGDAANKRASPVAGMVNFCPQCGEKVEATFNFCPSCGGRLPMQEEEPMQITPTPSLKELSQEGQDHLHRSPIKKKVEMLLDKEKACASLKQNLAATSPKAKAKPSSRSPRKDRGALVRPLPEGEILTDMSSKQWMLGKRLSWSDRGLMYEARCVSEACPPRQRYSLKLDAKDGRLFNEQNFFQRAAKKATVEKWKKQHSVPLLGIPDCIGFGLHNSHYRFLVFSDLGRSLQLILDDTANKMTEKAALQLAIRLLDVLEYLHENEYTHGDVAAENIYVNPADLAMITLADYCFAFRYSPGGKHVSQREGSRTPHEGTMEFISLDSHKGAGDISCPRNRMSPSRRSDLESLGYCLLKWLCSCLPWSEELINPCIVMEKKERYKTDVIKHPRLSYGWRAVPEALQSYLLQVMSLDYEEKPDYEELRTVLRRPLELMRASAYDSVDLKGN
ncbi:inactive serine/threonine-protein kinase VRK3 isoform X2 [Rhineura floridana]|uniref:inactive serine/threonine-protein kinase VRK3 isoform X2 n=1 Tax=Rhineura floridana TaxID=261503 RepID=UPI002AC87036|nr:inactive serine/threonine-protein kinase VRK3 isoform X2 [Rhineura floridana]